MYWLVKYDYLNYRPLAAALRVVTPSQILDGSFNFEDPRHYFEFAPKRQDDHPMPDFAFWCPPALLVSKRAFVAYRDIFAENGRFYPIGKKRRLYMVMIDTIFDVFDYKNSEFDKKGDPKYMTEDLKSYDTIGTISKFIITPPSDPEIDIFRPHGIITISVENIVSDRFKEIYESNKLTGLKFIRCDL